MKIAILGGGITGLTSAYYLAKDGHQVTILEKEKVLGGLASGFKSKNWNWYLERAYHHLFANDYDILNFAKEIDFDKIYFRSPETSSLFGNEIRLRSSSFDGQAMKQSNNFSVYPLDTPLDLLKFPLLGFIDKLRAGLVILFLKLSPFLSMYKKMTSEEFLKKNMGIKVWNTLWQQLFRGKFGKYAGIISSSFIWARIKKRTKGLGYVEGGFQIFISYLETTLKRLNVKTLKGYEVKNIEKRGEKFIIDGQTYDKIISTLPTPVMTKLTTNIFSPKYLSHFNKLKYLHAITLILETDKPILDKTYWLNICTEKIPFMILAQHTNFANKKNYNNNHLAYIGWYVDGDSKLLKMDKDELVKLVFPHLKKINPNCSIVSLFNSYMFKAPFAQPIFDQDFEKNMPTFKTPDKNFFIANLDMTYPYDRGTNYAVKLGKQVSEFI
ncbi:MAG: Amine oxidase [Candidatus Roizmanbacteria bacterium GW2011_GWC2_34_23]|uniref:Amine oxidase n=2 Tax=Candidatus Roizmaniibacteriota TaxID=1752723 RepID=A0A0G0AYA4_9BACT|nr:MAG: Amine oxidase [Candidatus Roizmanbacteria bacterium GW2011_GWC2_34_23]